MTITCDCGREAVMEDSSDNTDRSWEFHVCPACGTTFSVDIRTAEQEKERRTA